MVFDSLTGTHQSKKPRIIWNSLERNYGTKKSLVTHALDVFYNRTIVSFNSFPNNKKIPYLCSVLINVTFVVSTKI